MTVVGHCQWLYQNSYVAPRPCWDLEGIIVGVLLMHICRIMRLNQRL